ncbi:MAG TPA: Fur family transcriptional regulator [Spirochaetota bacterium]|nr:Fur family transcriptional regulator [Spirochaetota bacterium]
MKTDRETTQILHQAGIKASRYRKAVLIYLQNHPSHPSARTIFQDLKKKYPGLSFATVYNSLNTFSALAIIRDINIEGEKKYYDFNTSEHYHFFCEKCKKIFDITKDCLNLKLPLRSIDGHLIKKKDVNFTGICRRCLHQKKQKTEAPSGELIITVKNLNNKYKIINLKNAVHIIDSKALVKARIKKPRVKIQTGCSAAVIINAIKKAGFTVNY